MRQGFRRIAAALLLLAASLSLCAPARAAEFTDVDADHWAWEDVRICAELGVITGCGDGSFAPEEPVTSAQFIAMLTRAFYAARAAAVEPPEGEPWYYPYAVTAEKCRISANLTAVDETPLERSEAAIALCNVILREGESIKYTAEREQEINDSIKDIDGIADPCAAEAVRQCYALGILSGMEDGAFHGEEFMTRAQACAVITRMTDLISKAFTAPAAPAAQPEQPAGTPGLLANGRPVTVENVQAILEEIRAAYPAGTVWSAPGAAGNNYYRGSSRPVNGTRDVSRMLTSIGWGALSISYACGGWMAMISERIFGRTGFPAREVTDISRLRPGDIVIHVDSDGRFTHAGIVCNVWEEEGQWVFDTTDGNVVVGGSGFGIIRWGSRSWYYGDLSGFRCFTRYPEDGGAPADPGQAAAPMPAAPPGRPAPAWAGASGPDRSPPPAPAPAA